MRSKILLTLAAALLALAILALTGPKLPGHDTYSGELPNREVV